jgi:hypothetical protein
LDPELQNFVLNFTILILEQFILCITDIC